MPVQAIDVSSPITGEDGSIGCPTCNTSASTVTQYGVVIGSDGTRALSTVSVNGTGTKKYLQQTSSGAPSFDQVAIGDLSAMTSSDLAGKVSDETGTGALVLGTSPSITSPTIVTSIDLPVRRGQRDDGDRHVDQAVRDRYEQGRHLRGLGHERPVRPDQREQQPRSRDG
jgi:hypothetical protein